MIVNEAKRRDGTKLRRRPLRALSGVIPCIAMQGAALAVRRVGVVAKCMLGVQRSGKEVMQIRITSIMNYNCSCLKK